ncbi:MAG: Snf7 family protein, partial [Sulfolobaceae archaeon]
MIRLPFRRGGERVKSKDLLESVTGISIRIKELENKLEESLRRLKERDKELFEKTVRAKMDGDDARATIYAQEISDIRKMIKVIYTAQLALDRVRLKLETVHELQNFSMILPTAIKILDELKIRVKNVMPEVAIMFDSLVSNVNSLAIETGMINEKSINPTIIDEEARKVLDEAQRQAEIKMREILQEFPHPPL